MLCALTVRKLKPGSFEQFRDAFTRNDDPANPPAGWVRFNMLRNAEDPDEVICFGFYDGSLEQMRAASAEQGYSEQLNAVAPFVESVGADGVYEIVDEYTA